MKHTTNKFGPFLATIAAVIVAGAACSKDTTTTAPLVATSINANAGSSGQTGAISHALAAPVSVHVSDQSANAMAGAIVTWTVVGPGGSVDSATSTTNATGDAITHWTLGSTVGMQTLHATIVGGSFVSITASAVAGAATLLAKVSGDTQTVATGGAVSAAMVVKLTDALGNPVIGATITWASAAGTLSAASTTTDSTGKAHVTLTTAAGAQLYTITATSSGIAAVTFTITSPTGAGVAAFVAKVSGDTQTVAAGGSVSAPMVVKVTDIFGNPVVGTTVAWTSVTGTLSAASTTTDVNGKAQVTLDDRRGRANVFRCRDRNRDRGGDVHDYCTGRARSCRVARKGERRLADCGVGRCDLPANGREIDGRARQCHRWRDGHVGDGQRYAERHVDDDGHQRQGAGHAHDGGECTDIFDYRERDRRADGEIHDYRHLRRNSQEVRE